MADKKISALPVSTTPLAGTEVLPIVQSGTTKQVSAANLTAGRAVAMLSNTVGTSPGAVTPTVQADDLVVQNSGAAGITILSPDANAGRVVFGTVSNNQNVVLYGEYNYGFDVYLVGNKVIHFDTPTKDTTWSLGNLVQGTAAKGINFTANTGAAGKTSQLLNWYEEGTWTPTVTFGGNATGLTYSRQFGRYTRIGNMVTIYFQFDLTAKGSSTGNASIAGLPFANQNTTGNILGFSPYTDRVNSAIQLVLVPNATSFVLYDRATTGGSNTQLTDTAFTNTSFVSGSFSYVV